MAEINPATLKLEEYATQFLGFTPKSFCNGVYNSMNDYIIECMKAVQSYLTEKCSDSLTEEQIEEGTNAILHQYMANFSRTFERFESYVFKNIFSIPSNVLLAEDSPQKVQYSPESELLLDQQIEELKMKVWTLKTANAKLRSSLAEIERSSKNLDSATTKLHALQDVMSKSGFSHPDESLQLIYDNIQNGKKLIVKLSQDMNHSILCIDDL
ncbi:protein MIS12 homolog [Argonauta hians]